MEEVYAFNEGAQGEYMGTMHLSPRLTQANLERLRADEAW